MNKLYMMVGLPASGKSTLAKQISQNEDAEIVSSDEIRKELYGDENIQGNSNKVFERLHRRIIEGLKAGKNMIYDSTNINYKRRMAFLQRLNKLDVKKIAVMVATPYEECLIRNANRERKVPEEVIKRMYYNFYVPQYFEGFDKIKLYSNSSDWSQKTKKIYTMDNLLENMNISHDNPHHSLSILEHCQKVQSILNNKGRRYYIENLGLFHDMGKIETKSFTNSKEEITDIAHYYNHEKVSAYISCLPILWKKYISKDDLIERAKLIQWHMLPWSNMSEKTENKYKKLLGEDFWGDLMELHEADKEAH